MKEKEMLAASISTIVGSVKSCYLRLSNKDYLSYFEGPMEITSLVGTIVVNGPHIHISLSNG